MAASVSPSPRSQRTRAALIAAGLDLLVERPIDAIPIDDLVSHAGVAKGSFFNHFPDKQGFAAAVAAELRLELEERVARANAGITDPVARIAGGMMVAAAFAEEEPRRTMVLLRSQTATTSQNHPLNRGLKDDIEAAIAMGVLRPETQDTGLLYWLGLCQVLMAHLAETRPTQRAAADKLAEMLTLGLTGLGVPLPRVEQLAKSACITSPN